MNKLSAAMIWEFRLHILGPKDYFLSLIEKSSVRPEHCSVLLACSSSPGIASMPEKMVSTLTEYVGIIINYFTSILGHEVINNQQSS